MTLSALLAMAPTRTDLVVHDDHRLSSTELATRATRIAGALNGRGIGHGDRVAFQLPVGIDAIALCRACWLVGVVPVALDPCIGPDRLGHAIDAAEPSLLVSEAGLPLAVMPACVALVDLTGGAVPAIHIDAADDGIVVFPFASADSPSPKSLTRTHGSLAHTTRAVIDQHDLTAADAMLLAGSFADITAVAHGILVPGALSAKAVLMPRWDAGTALDLIEREGVTWMIGPPAVFVALMDHPDFRTDRVASVRLVSFGGADVTPAVADRVGTELAATPVLAV